MHARGFLYTTRGTSNRRQQLKPAVKPIYKSISVKFASFIHVVVTCSLTRQLTLQLRMPLVFRTSQGNLSILSSTSESAPENLNFTLASSSSSPPPCRWTSRPHRRSRRRAPYASITGASNRYVQHAQKLLSPVSRLQAADTRSTSSPAWVIMLQAFQLICCCCCCFAASGTLLCMARASAAPSTGLTRTAR